MPSFRRFLLLSFLSFTTLHSTASQESTDPVQSEVGLIYPTPCPQYIQIINMYGTQQYGIPCCMTKDSICNNRYIPVCTPVPNCTGDSCYKTKTNLCHACTDPDVSVYIMGACPSKPPGTSSSTGGSKPPTSTGSSSSGQGGSKPSTGSSSGGGNKPPISTTGSSSPSSGGGGGNKPTTGSSSGENKPPTTSSGSGSGSGSTSTPTKPVKGPVKKTSIFVNKSSTSTKRIVKTPKKKSKK